MRTTLRWIAATLAMAVFVVWLARGANTGWTKNLIERKEKDPVTELEVKRYEPGWVPGMDFLVPGLAAAGLLGGVSFLVRRRKLA